MNLQKEHGKIYIGRPKVLTFACECCHKKYTHEFQNLVSEMLWQKELKEIKCPFCKLPRI